MYVIHESTLLLIKCKFISFYKIVLKSMFDRSVNFEVLNEKMFIWRLDNHVYIIETTFEKAPKRCLNYSFFIYLYICFYRGNRKLIMYEGGSSSSFNKFSRDLYYINLIKLTYTYSQRSLSFLNTRR